MNTRNVALRERLFAALLEGKTPKRFAIENSVSQSWAYRLTWELGFRSIYVSEQEQQQLKKIRNEY